MYELIHEFVEGCEFTSPANVSPSDELISLHLPDDFMNIYQYTNGCEGFWCDYYIIIWRMEELLTYNLEYEVQDYAPGIFLVGSNGGGEAIGYDLRSEEKKLIQVPFIGMCFERMLQVADSFEDLLLKMKTGNYNGY